MVNELVLLTQAEVALANIGDITDAKNLIDIAKAASVFYAAQGLREQSDRAKIIELKAARVAGKLLMVMDKAPGGHPYHNTNEENKPVPTVPTLADLDITKWESHRWQLLARLPDEDFYHWLDEHLGTG